MPSDMEGWSVCIEHRGLHSVRLGACTNWCGAHAGRHGMIAGECYAMGREVPRPYTFAFLRCRECGAEVTHRRERATGRTVILEPGTDTEHRHAPAVPGRVELDVDSLAGAIVRASRAAREERRADRSDTPQPSNAVAPPASKPDPDGLQTVEVWPV